MEHGFYGLAATGAPRGQVIEFTASDDPHWSGVVELRPGQAFAVAMGRRTDIYILKGEVFLEGIDPIRPGGFLSLADDYDLEGGKDGAILLVYQEPAFGCRHLVDLPCEARSWRPARIPGMRIADLTIGDYQLALVHWAPGTQVHPHSHAHGEELFVLCGELQVNGKALPAGSWLRLGAELHTPSAVQSTLILLRSGHLRPDLTRLQEIHWKTSST